MIIAGTRDALVTIRPIRASDLAMHAEFVDSLSASTRYQRLLSSRRPSLDELRRCTDIDPRREFALIATAFAQRGDRQIGVARYVRLADEAEAEAAIVIGDDWQGRGLGGSLLLQLLCAARFHGVRRVVGTSLVENRRMLAMARRIGCSIGTNRESALVRTLGMDLDGCAARAANGEATGPKPKRGRSG